MNSQSGSGSSGTFVWGLIAGLIAVIAAGGVYLSGIFGGNPETPVPSASETTTSQPQSAETGQSSTSDENSGEQVNSDDAPNQEQPTEPVEDVPSEPETTEAAAGITDPVAETEQADSVTEPVRAAPALDQIFLATDGNALLSGNADPGSQVRVLLDGETVHSFTVDETGEFAEFVSIPFSDDARGIVLETVHDAGALRSDDYLIAALPEPEPLEPIDEPVETPTAETVEIPALEALEPTPETETVEEDPETKTAPETEVAADEPEAQPEPTTPQGQQVAILRSGEEGVELVQAPTAQNSAPDQVALDTIGYSDEGDVELTGRARDGSVVRLYLDNRLVADADPEENGIWRGEIQGIDPGVYTLRVDEVASDGTVVSRLETPFKREPVEALRAVETQNPEDTTPEIAPIRSVTVQKGDTLWAISRDRFGDGVLYVKLFEANRDAIRDPDLIYPGQIFTIPE